MNRIEFYSKLDKYKADKANEEKEKNGGSLSHYGIPKMKWGQRRWQNADGTFNEEGKIRYFGKNGTTKKNKEEKPASKKNLQDQKIGSGWGDKERSMLKDMSSSKLREYYDVVKDMGRGTTDYHQILTDVNRELSSRGEDKVGSSKDQKIGMTGIYDIAAGVISVKNAINNYDDVQALRESYSNFMKNSDQDYSDAERLSVLNNKKKIAKIQDALEMGDEEKYNKLVGKIKKGDKEAVEKFLKDYNKKNNETMKPDEDTAKKLEDSVFDEKVGSLSKPKVSKTLLNADGTLNERGKTRVSSNKKISDIASSVFLALRNFKLYELASLPVAGAVLALSGFGVPAVIATALAGTLAAPSIAIDNALYKKLEKRADAYYDMLSK